MAVYCFEVLAVTPLMTGKTLDIELQVMDVYDQIDKAVAEFQLKSGLRCSSGCSRCCPESDVQATVLEMLPVAREILRHADTTDWLERLADLPESSPCILYSDQPMPDAGGNCIFYKWRPVLCRLFGFAAIRTRTGEKALSVCRHIKQADPLGAAAAMKMAGQAPCFVHYSSQITGLRPDMGTRLMPINKALHHAIQRIGLYISYSHKEMLRDNTAA